MRHSTAPKTLTTLAATAALALLAACGGGGGSGTAPPPDGGNGTSASAIAYGTITAFGSVWVNGVEYETGSAAVRFDDSPGGADDLRVGMVVRIDGSADDRSASAITVDSAVKGRVEAVLDANRMIVMGQTIRIDAQTLFDNGVVPAAGDVVEVHGLVAGDGAIAAGYVERKSKLADPPFAVKGLVKNHDTVAQSFAIGALLVRYGAGTTVSDLPGGSWNGLQVEVKGTNCAGSPVCGTLSASKVEPDGLGVDTTPHTEFEGYVTLLTADGFVLGAQRVVVTPATRWEGGVASEVAVGTKLEVEGSIAGGVLTAVKVSLRDNVRLEGNVTSVNAAAGTITLAGLPGVTIGVDSLTELEDLASLSSLPLSSHVRVRGRSAGGSAVAASELELRSTAPDSRVVLQGAVSAISGTRSFTLLGVVVDTSGVADDEFKGLADQPIGRSAFFAALRVGSLVKARGKLGGSLAWDEVELED
jgi:Domain of unknown function (DUF5666)